MESISATRIGEILSVNECVCLCARVCHDSLGMERLRQT